MFAGRVFKRNLLAATIVAEATAVAEAQFLSHKHEEKPLCRPSELPIYTPEPEVSTERLRQIEAENAPGAIEQTVKTVRHSVFRFSEEVAHLKQVAFNELDKQQENLESLVEFLREEENTVPRAGAVGIGALAGLVFGLRGGLIKKTLYATTGALAMAAVCYPKEASEYTQVGMKEGKKYLTIAYNFIYGDNPPASDQKPEAEQVSQGTVKGPAPPVNVPFENFPNEPAPENLTENPAPAELASFVEDDAEKK